MNVSHLEKNICDTVKEWQLKLGYQEEAMGLYYPMESLKELLGEFWDLPKTAVADTSQAVMAKASAEEARQQMLLVLEQFAAEVWPRLGRLAISHEGDRFCLKIPAEGVRYIHENWQESPFLQDFLQIMNREHVSLTEIRRTFEAFGDDVVEEIQQEPEGTEYVFYFASGMPDEYVYCIHLDDFGATYHRFVRSDYEKLYQE